jgi:hypothetical protein
MKAKLEFKAVFHLLDLARCYNLAKSSSEGYPELTLSKKKDKDEIKFEWHGEYSSIEWIETLKKLDCTCKSDEFEFTLDSFTFYTIFNNLRYKTVELKELRNKITITYETQSIDIKKIPKRPESTLKVHDVYDVSLDTFKEAQEQHSKIPGKQGIVVFKDKHIISEDSRFRTAICVTTLKTDVYKKECTIEKKKIDTVFSITSEAFSVVSKLMKHGNKDLKVGFSKTLNGLNRVRFSSNNISIITATVSETRYGKLKTIISKATALSALSTATFEKRKLEEMLKLAQAPENDKVNLLISFSNMGNIKECTLKTDTDTFNSTIPVVSTCEFEFTVNAMFLAAIYREVKAPTEFKFDKKFPAVIIASGTEEFIIPCIYVNQHKYTIK